MKILTFISILLILAGCSTYKAYQKVAADPVVDAREAVLLKQKCLSVWPEKISPPVLIGTGIDSSAYNAWAAANNELLDMLLEKTAAYDSLALRDSVRIIKEFITKYRPPAVRVVDTVQVEVVSSEAVAALESQRQEIIGLRAENAKLTQDKEDAEARLKNTKAATGWVVAGGFLLSILTFIIGNISKNRT